MDALRSEPRLQAVVEEDVRMPIIGTKPEVIAENKGDKETDPGQL